MVHLSCDGVQCDGDCYQVGVGGGGRGLSRLRLHFLFDKGGCTRTRTHTVRQSVKTCETWALTWSHGQAAHSPLPQALGVMGKGGEGQGEGGSSLTRDRSG